MVFGVRKNSCRLRPVEFRIALAERAVTCIILPHDVQPEDYEAPRHEHAMQHSSIGFALDATDEVIAPRRSTPAIPMLRPCAYSSRAGDHHGGVVKPYSVSTKEPLRANLA